MTDGKGTYAICGMEDTGTLQSLTWLARADKVDLDRVLVLRTASNFDVPSTARPPPNPSPGPSSPTTPPTSPRSTPPTASATSSSTDRHPLAQIPRPPAQHAVRLTPCCQAKTELNDSIKKQINLA